MSEFYGKESFDRHVAEVVHGMRIKAVACWAEGSDPDYGSSPLAKSVWIGLGGDESEWEGVRRRVTYLANKSNRGRSQEKTGE